MVSSVAFLAKASLSPVSMQQGLRAAKPSAWIHHDGEHATIELLADKLLPHSDFLGKHGPTVYSSTCMKIGIDVEMLAAALPVIRELLLLDPRGGHFIQQHVAAAVRVNLFNKVWAKSSADVWDMQPAGALEMLAYKLRTMCAHTRLVFDGCITPGAHKLASLFEILARPPAEASPMDVKRQRRSQRLSNRPHPFPFFRLESSPDLPALHEEEPTKVAKQFDGVKASMLMSDGTTLNADVYEAGTEGMACAK